MLQFIVHFQQQLILGRLSAHDLTLRETMANMFKTAARIAVLLVAMICSHIVNSQACQGRYSYRSYYNALNNLCADCYNIYREPIAETLCRADCFSTPALTQCVGDTGKQDCMIYYIYMAAAVNGGSVDHGYTREGIRGFVGNGVDPSTCGLQFTTQEQTEILGYFQQY